MNVKEFVSAYNSQVPSVEQIIDKNPNLSYLQAEEERGGMMIAIVNVEDKLDNTLDCLISNTNLPRLSVGAINFEMKIWQVGDALRHFASYNDYYKICLHQINGSIVLYDEGQDYFETLSTSFEQFLHFLYIYSAYDRAVIFGDGAVSSEIQKELEVLIDRGFDRGFVANLIN